MLGTITTVAGAGGLALYVSREAYSQGGLFAWHPFCMSMGALFLSTAGIHAVRSRRAVQGIGPKETRVQLHSACSNLALVCMLGGTYAIYTNKEEFAKPHLTTWHAWAGILTLALWVANVGNAAFNTADIQKRRVWFLWTSRNHRWLGFAAYAAGLVAVCFGLHSGWGVRVLGGERGAWRLTAAVAALFVGVVYQGLAAIGKNSASPKKVE